MIHLNQCVIISEAFAFSINFSISRGSSIRYQVRSPDSWTFLRVSVLPVLRELIDKQDNSRL